MFFFIKSGPVLLRNHIFVVFQGGGESGPPAPPPPSGSAHEASVAVHYKGFRVVSAVIRFGHESFRPWVVSAGSFRPGLFRPDFRAGRFGLIWWVVSAQYPNPPPPPPIFYITRDTVFFFLKSLTSLCSPAVTKEPSSRFLHMYS